MHVVYEYTVDGGASGLDIQHLVLSMVGSYSQSLYSVYTYGYLFKKNKMWLGPFRHVQQLNIIV